MPLNEAAFVGKNYKNHFSHIRMIFINFKSSVQIMPK